MFGLIGKIRTHDGKRDEVITIMRDGTRDMAGCKLYLIAADAEDSNAIVVTEVWESEAAHQASLQIPEVREVIKRAMPMIAGVEAMARTIPYLD